MLIIHTIKLLPNFNATYKKINNSIYTPIYIDDIKTSIILYFQLFNNTFVNLYLCKWQLNSVEQVALHCKSIAEVKQFFKVFKKLGNKVRSQ